jgi:hypothetical protein
MNLNNKRPVIYSEENRVFWDIVRRFIIMLLRQLDEWYGWHTIVKK